MSLRLRPVFRCFYSCKFRFLTTQEPEVKIIRRETIKPAFRIPRQTKTTYKLSLLDQIIPPFHFPLVFFYPNNRNTGNIDLIKNILKQSIAETLTLFYPLAGKIKDDLWIDCNDEGMYYVEARINSHLSEVLDLSRPDYQMIHQLVPRVSPTEMEPKTEGVYVVMVQLNIFECGGIALALSTSHKIMDGYTVDTFLKSWVASARGTPQPGHLNLAASHLFPQNISLPKDSKLFTWPPLFKEGDCVTRRLVFDGSALVALKAKAASSSSSLVQNPTRIEVVSGLLWKAASKARHGFEKPSVFSQIVDVRRRMSPALPGCPIGNFLWLAVTQSMLMPSTRLELGCLVGQLRKAKEKITNGFVQKLQGDKGFVEVIKSIEGLGELYFNEGVDCFFSTSFCRTSLYETDFGWGKPAWVIDGTAGEDDQSFNFFLMDTRLGDGIEAWVSLSKREMEELERDSEINEFVSFDPSPLIKLADASFS